MLKISSIHQMLNRLKPNPLKQPPFKYPKLQERTSRIASNTTPLELLDVEDEHKGGNRGNRAGPQGSAASSRPRRMAGSVTVGSLCPLFSRPVRSSSLDVAPAAENHRPASPGRRGGGSPATTGPRSDPGPIPPSSAGSPAPPASGSSTDGPPAAGLVSAGRLLKAYFILPSACPRSAARWAPQAHWPVGQPVAARPAARRSGPTASPWSPRHR